jgi:uncharacterized delta-60 repeat protein
VNGEHRQRIARLNADGSLDTSFLDGMDGPNQGVGEIALEPDGHILIAGDFETVNGTSGNRIARLNTDGSVDPSLSSRRNCVNGRVGDLAVEPGGRVVIAGGFTKVQETSRGRIARLNDDGSLDTSFLDGLAGADADVAAVALQADGRVLVAGEFTHFNGSSRGRVARLNDDGSLDASFLDGPAGADRGVLAIVVQGDGRALIAGGFHTVNGVSRERIARLNADGSLDTTFVAPWPNGDILGLAVQPWDGRVLIAGMFTTVGGAPRGGVARLNADGSLDATFVPLRTTYRDYVPDNPYTLSLALQPGDGDVLVGRSTAPYPHGDALTRLHPHGPTDRSFEARIVNQVMMFTWVHAIAVQNDGRVLIGGFFTTVDGTERFNLARLYGDGSLDESFLDGRHGASGAGYNVVDALAVDPRGFVMVGGSFHRVNDVPSAFVARLFQEPR